MRARQPRCASSLAAQRGKALPRQNRAVGAVGALPWPPPACSAVLCLSELTSPTVLSTSTSPMSRKHLRPSSMGCSAPSTSPCSCRSMSSSLILRHSAFTCACGARPASSFGHARRRDATQGASVPRSSAVNARCCARTHARTHARATRPPPTLSDALCACGAPCLSRCARGRAPRALISFLAQRTGHACRAGRAPLCGAPRAPLLRAREERERGPHAPTPPPPRTPARQPAPIGGRRGVRACVRAARLASPRRPAARARARARTCSRIWLKIRRMSSWSRGSGSCAPPLPLPEAASDMAGPHARTTRRAD